ncbi:hypothetical protein GHK92_12690 [Nocardioides sp. dk4132]|uniref:hypothetical protein n=1 Tax=unclassified Nocardioides TaxID=2615069 RepID=UPI0012955CDA|nr:MULTISPECIES: hypothetical protein [unclassified Nocardioides]MQW76736.1 hypothetical protein [Nocardioides sp. dk4132]QGA06907.1 hypothetical protein GFH29_05530 [Nocardioides sp. dk884]
MTPWLRTRRVAAPLGAALLCGVVLFALQNRFFVMPVVVGTDGMMLWSTLIPLIWAIGVADCFGSKTQSAEARPARRTLILDAGLLLALAAVGVGVFTAATGPDESATGTAGHVLILTGIACMFAMRAGSAAGALASTSLLIVTSFYGRDAPAGPYIRILQPDGHPTWALFVGVLACLAALALILLDNAAVNLAATHRSHD